MAKMYPSENQLLDCVCPYFFPIWHVINNSHYLQKNKEIVENWAICLVT